MKQENSSFIAFDNAHPGLIFDDTKHPLYPIAYYNMINGDGVTFNPKKSYFGYCYEGIAVLVFKNGYEFRLEDGMFFSSQGDVTSKKGWPIGKCIIIEIDPEAGQYAKSKYRAYRMFGGPIEAAGRLKYIDGCTDSLLLPPIKKGDPCFNHLHFPANIDQTQHTHPSHRIGVVAKGSGTCITPFGNLPLTKGMIFVIKEWDGITFDSGHPIGQHAFKTTDEEMDVIAFHPDSDFGPEDEFHPMINRTMVDGISANQIEAIRTK